MKETGLMFKAPLVRAILSGQKTQSRRVLKQAVGPSLSVGIDDANPDVAELSWLYGDGPGHEVHESIKRVPCPFGKPGDRIYVRETFAWVPTACESDEIVFAADYQDGSDKAAGVRYIPSIHMPKAAARIWLDITGVRLERLQAISEEDAEAEGVGFLRSVPDADETLTAKQLFECLWDSTGGDWAANPWVWVIDFKRIEAKAKKED